MANLRCPECGAPEGEFKFNVITLTTEEDRWVGIERYALRCEVCGLATSFVGERKKTDGSTD